MGFGGEFIYEMELVQPKLNTNIINWSYSPINSSNKFPQAITMCDTLLVGKLYTRWHFRQVLIIIITPYLLWITYFVRKINK